MNTQHMTITNSTLAHQIAAPFFSHPLAITLYTCVQDYCQQHGVALPNIDEGLPKRISLPACMFELYEKCGGKDMEAIYKQVMDGGMLDSEARCYKDGCF
jgi:hypothetical protein